MGTTRRYKTTDNRCTRCLTNVENMSRTEQDLHEIECKKQERLV